MRILILGEGPTDCGRFDQEGIPEQEGVIQILVRKLLHQEMPDINLEFRVRKLPIKVTKRPSQIVKPSRYGYYSQLSSAIALAEGRWAEAFVVLVDRDEKKYQSRIDELNEAGEFLKGEKKLCAVGMAIEEIEAWLLADERALRTALEDDSIQMPPNPEKLTSRDDSSRHNPKGLLGYLMQKALEQDIPSDEFCRLASRIAQEIDLSRLEKRCTDGFKPFAGQVREMLKDL
jgi:hypothetical protein